MNVIPAPNPIMDAAKRREWMLTPQQLFDREAIARDIAAAAASGLAGEELRKEAVGLMRQALENGRDLARRALEATAGGLACASHLSIIEDELIRALFDFTTTYLRPPPPDVARNGMAIAAVGGYGRGTLAPGSDIDLLFLLPTKPTPSSEKLVETMLYMLWDLRQKVGHSTRSIGECIRQAKADMTIRTSLLEARFILGDEPLFDEMRKRFDAEIVAGSAHDFVAAKLAERDERLKRAGGSRYLVEPNVKDGKGGIRDLNKIGRASCG